MLTVPAATAESPYRTSTVGRFTFPLAVPPGSACSSASRVPPLQNARPLPSLPSGSASAQLPAQALYPSVYGNRFGTVRMGPVPVNALLPVGTSAVFPTTVGRADGN